MRKKHILAMGFLIFSVGAFADGNSSGNNGGFMNQGSQPANGFNRGVTITGGVAAASTATGNYTGTYATGNVEGDGKLQTHGVQVGGNAQSGFDAGSKQIDYGSSSANGQAALGLNFNALGGSNWKGFTGNVAEQAESHASGTKQNTSTWTNGGLWGNADLNRGNQHANVSAETGNAATDKWSTDAFSKGASALMGEIQIQMNH
ncbi:MAG TPA: hypothetical protein VFM02_04475 [Candidatus Paceibacterota bacterium]|nr:hypothetical protein [Candidatus Paceibacterota bacterium]